MRITIHRPASVGRILHHHAALRTGNLQARWIHQNRPRPRTAYVRPSHEPARPLKLQQQRTFIAESLPSILVPPFVFTSLLLTLWAYKCVMTVLFQDKIIYMPYIGRSEKMEDYKATCKPVEWEHRHINSIDGTKIALCVGKILKDDVDIRHDGRKKKHVVICYFQGNGSSTPPRLPLLSNMLKSIDAQEAAESGIQFSLVALSYRGYWTSAGRASQAGIELDAQALLQWIQAEYGNISDLELILWGQSIGAGVASTAAATYLSHQSIENPPIAGLVLETPFSDIKSMLTGLYPQRWLPYRYLWPFLWNHWDSMSALRRIAECDQRPNVLLLPATRDEVVPRGEAEKIERLSRDLGLPIQRKDIFGALHTEATTRREGQAAVAHFVLACTATT